MFSGSQSEVQRGGEEGDPRDVACLGGGRLDCLLHRGPHRAGQEILPPQVSRYAGQSTIMLLRHRYNV